MLYTYRFDAFGNQLLPNDMPDHNPLTATQNTTNTNPFRFAGEYLDFETGNIYLRARYFNPRTGRFTQEDPHWGLHNMQSNALSILQSSNLYAGMLNNPIRWNDPSGRSVIPAFILVATRPPFEPPRSGAMILNPDDRDTILSYLQQLTDHTLLVDDRGALRIGRWVLRNYETLPVGNRLIEAVIVNIRSSVNFVLAPGAENMIIPLAARNSFQIQFDPDATMDGRPAFIGLAHELIHYYLITQGQSNDWMMEYTTRTIYAIDDNMQTRRLVDRTRKIEFAVIGLHGYNNPARITENMIRAEHGVPLRPAYNRPDLWGYFR